MGAFLDKPKVEKTSAYGEGNDLRYAVSCMQGWRVEMEDAHTTIAAMEPDEQAGIVAIDPVFQTWSFFAIFDGHAGVCSSRYSSKNIARFLLDTSEFQNVVKLLRSAADNSTQSEVDENAVPSDGKSSSSANDLLISRNSEALLRPDLRENVRNGFVSAFLKASNVCDCTGV